MSKYKPLIEEYKTLADIVRAVDIPEPTVRSHAKIGLIDIIKQEQRIYVTQKEFERVVNSYNTRGFVLPVEYEGWRTVEEMSKDIAKSKSAIWRYLVLGYIKGAKVRLKGRNGAWVIEPASYDAFVKRYKEAHSHLENWHTVKEYAAAIRLSPMWVRDLIRMRRIEADKITRREAMLVTKDEHTYRIPPHEMECARQVGQMLSIGKVLESIVIDNRHFSWGYFLYKVFPALGIENSNAPTRKARIKQEDIPKIIEYVLANSRTLHLIDRNNKVAEYNRTIREMCLDSSVLDEPAPILNDNASLENEKKLWLLVKQRNETALRMLIETYTPFIRAIAYSSDQRTDIDSKLARGVYGLWLAIINAYDLRNIRAYAKRWIKGNIMAIIAEDRGKKTISLESQGIDNSDDNRTLGERIGVN